MTNTIDFMGKRKVMGVLSVILVIASVLIITFNGVERSVDFAGGTALTVSFPNDDVTVGDLRDEVSRVDEKATIFSIQDSTGATFSIKIKNPEVEEGAESEASLARLRGLEHAFSLINNDEGELLALLTEKSPEDLTQRLMASNPYGIEGADSEKRSVYSEIANKVVANAANADRVDGLAEQADPENSFRLGQALSLTYPAINRVSEDLLRTILSRRDPLNRGADADYNDIAGGIEAVRESNDDFIGDWDQLFTDLELEATDREPLESFLKSNFTVGHYRIISNETFSPSIAAELLSKAWSAILLALLGILLYVSARFNRGYAVSSVLALAHDVTIALGFFSLVGAELSNPVVAAFLTIVGYSLNDTIVVFDRIRDNLQTTKAPNVEKLMNESINQTLSRTVVTSLTTLFVVGVIFLASNQTLRDFAFPLLIGIVVGTYSSIFVASPALLFWHEKIQKITGK